MAVRPLTALSRLKPLVLSLAVGVAPAAFGQTPQPAPLPAACTPWVVPVDAQLADTNKLAAAFGSASLAEFQADWRKRLATSSADPVFPHARVYARSFETGAVAYLYERAVFQADPSALAALVRLQESTVPSIASDAMAALAFIHFQRNTEASQAQGLALIQQARRGDSSYPATVFWGRANAWGGGYATQNLAAAMNFLAQAGRLPGERQAAGRRMDALNLQELHASTLRHLMANEPQLPHRNVYENLVAQANQIDQMQVAFTRQFEGTAALAATNLALQNLEAVLAAPATTRAFRAVLATPRASGFARLSQVLEGMEDIAQDVHSLPVIAPAQRATLDPLRTTNEGLIQALDALSRQLVSEQMADRASFPQIVRRVQALTAVQRGLSRSCSLAVTWGTSTDRVTERASAPN
jgi:hypothetical protein